MLRQNVDILTAREDNHRAEYSAYDLGSIFVCVVLFFTCMSVMLTGCTRCNSIA